MRSFFYQISCIVLFYSFAPSVGLLSFVPVSPGLVTISTGTLTIFPFHMIVPCRCVSLTDSVPLDGFSRLLNGVPRPIDVHPHPPDVVSRPLYGFSHLPEYLSRPLDVFPRRTVFLSPDGLSVLLTASPVSLTISPRPFHGLPRPRDGLPLHLTVFPSP